VAQTGCIPDDLDISKVRFVPRKIEHHGAHSGYDRLFEYLGLESARSPLGIRLHALIPHGLAWRLWQLRPQETQATGLEAELGAAPWIAFGNSRLCHFIYGEDTYLLTPLWKNSRNRCIATFHYPSDRLIERINPGPLRALDGAIIVGENQRDYFSRFLPAERIHFCPHPVDAEFFCPGPAVSPARPQRLICAGHLFRKYDDLLQVLRRIRAVGIEVDVHVVGPKKWLAEFALFKEFGVFLHSGVSDEALRDFYRSAAVGVMPMSDSTANNGLLEMMACGLPVVASRVGGVPEYTNGSAVRLVAKDDIDSMAQAICELLGDEGLRASEGARNRAHAVETLSMPAIAERMLTIYRHVFQG
jgi:glycosyltransferase involved in cell wall biosynthesis